MFLQVIEDEKIIKAKSASDAELEEKVRVLIESRKKLSNKHETSAENLRQKLKTRSGT